MADYYPTFTQEEFQQEAWQAIPGFEGLYEASSLGRVRSCPRKPAFKGRLRSPNLTVKGYLSVVLYREGKRYSPIGIHRLVAWTFLGPQPKNIVVNHLDGNPRNNRLSNLEYCTRKEDAQHALRTGLKPVGDRHWSKLHPELRARGEGHGMAKLTEIQAREIKHLLTQGVGPTAAARQVGCSIKSAKDISAGKTWKHLN